MPRAGFRPRSPVSVRRFRSAGPRRAVIRPPGSYGCGRSTNDAPISSRSSGCGPSNAAREDIEHSFEGGIGRVGNVLEHNPSRQVPMNTWGRRPSYSSRCPGGAKAEDMNELRDQENVAFMSSRAIGERRLQLYPGEIERRVCHARSATRRSASVVYPRDRWRLLGVEDAAVRLACLGFAPDGVSSVPCPTRLASVVPLYRSRTTSGSFVSTDGVDKTSPCWSRSQYLTVAESAPAVTLHEAAPASISRSAVSNEEHQNQRQHRLIAISAKESASWLIASCRRSAMIIRSRQASGAEGHRVADECEPLRDEQR